MATCCLMGVEMTTAINSNPPFQLADITGQVFGRLTVIAFPRKQMVARGVDVRMHLRQHRAGHRDKVAARRNAIVRLPKV